MKYSSLLTHCCRAYGRRFLLPQGLPLFGRLSCLLACISGLDVNLYTAITRLSLMQVDTWRRRWQKRWSVVQATPSQPRPSVHPHLCHRSHRLVALLTSSLKQCCFAYCLLPPAGCPLLKACIALEQRPLQLIAQSSNTYICMRLLSS